MSETTTTAYRCGCGEWAGEACEWTGPLADMVVVEYMPESLRDSHRAARNSGSWPHNGSSRVAVERSCADLLLGVEGEAEWSRVTDLDPADYVSAE
jgi:hypothetical protein